MSISENAEKYILKIVSKLLRLTGHYQAGEKITSSQFYKKAQLFKLGPAYELGVETAKFIGLTGRACNTRHDYGVLAQMVFNAGEGDHLEIGTLYGASAIIAGTVKKHYKHKGDIICVDPLDGYYGRDLVDKLTGKTPSAEILTKNLKAFGIERYKIINKASYPWPQELQNAKFSSALIDGDHDGEGPYQDWVNARERTSRYVMFDNYDKEHPAVIFAVNLTQLVPNWTLVYMNSIQVIIEYRR